MKQCGMSDLVVEKGYLSPADFQAAIQASEILGHQLAVPESWGNHLEPFTRAMGFGKPVVVYRQGPFTNLQEMRSLEFTP